MPRPISLLCFLLFLFYSHFKICDGSVSVSDLNPLKSSDIDAMVTGACAQNIEDCLTETGMSSETSRRVLMMQRRYISYETLKRDMVPCQRPGASYYDCRAGQANSYNRGCEVITRCARDVRDTRT